MPEWLDSAPEWAGLLTAVAIVTGALIWLIRAQIAVGKQFEKNGGNSLRDQVDFIRESQRENRKDLREIRTTLAETTDRLARGVGAVHARLDDHLRDHLKG